MDTRLTMPCFLAMSAIWLMTQMCIRDRYDGADVKLKGESTQDDSTVDPAGASAGGPEGNAPGGQEAPMTGNKAQ